MKKTLLFLLSAIFMPIVVSAQPQTNGTYKDDGYTYPQGVIQCLHGPLPTGGSKTTKEAWQAWPTDANLQVFRRTDGNEGVIIKYNSSSSSQSNTKGYYGQLLFTITSYDAGTKTGTVELGGTYSRYSTASNYNVKLFTRQFKNTNGIKYNSTYYPNNGDECPSYLNRIVIPVQITVNSDASVAGYYQGNSLAGATFTVTAVSDECVKNIRFLGSSSSSMVECWLPSTITRIGNSAFKPSSSNNITHYKFYSSLDGNGNPIEDANGNNVTEIGSQAFSSSSEMKTLPVDSKIQMIGENAFSNCNSLVSVDLSDCSLLTEISNWCFSYCSALSSVTLPNSLQNIGNFAFSGCSGLTSLTFPNSLKNIGNFAFYGCNIDDVIFPPYLETIGDYAFNGNGLTSIESLSAALTQNKTLQYIGEEAFRGNNIRYLKWETADKYHENFRIGSSAFYSQRCELTVEMDDACTTVPEYLKSSGYLPPFGGQTQAILGVDDSGNTISLPNCLRVIVPLNYVSTYRTDNILGQIPLHDYRVKYKWGTFTNQTTLNEDLAKDFDQRSYYGLYNITPQQRLIATTSWKNDALCFRPQMILNIGGGGEVPWGEEPEISTEKWYANTVDYWDSDAKTATVLETEDNFFNKDAFAFNNKSFDKENEASYPQSLMPYTIHTFHANVGSEEVEQLGRRPVTDGMVPANVGIVIDFPKPGYYLVPPAIVEFGEQYRWKYAMDKNHVPFFPESKTQISLDNENPYYSTYPNFKDFIVRDTLLAKKDKDALILFRKDDLVALESEVTVEGLQTVFANALIYTQDENGNYTGFDIGYEYNTSEWFPDYDYYYIWYNAFFSNHYRYLSDYINGINVGGQMIKNRNTEVEYVAHLVDCLYFQEAENPSGLLTTNDLEVYWWNELGLVSDMDPEYNTSTNYKGFTKDDVAYVQQTEEVAMNLYKFYRFDNYLSISDMVGIIESGYGYTEEYVPWDVIFEEFMYGYWSYDNTWIDIWNPLVDFASLGSHFATNHDSENDHNVIIGLPDRFPLFPYWAASPYIWDDAAHDDDHLPLEQRFDNVEDYTTYKAFVHGRMGNGNTFVNMKHVEEGTATFADTDIHYVNFGISKGYFVQINTKPASGGSMDKWTQPNRAYFSISRAHMPHIFDSSNNGKLAIFLEDNDHSTTGIDSLDDVGVSSESDGWYTLQGVRLSSKPVQHGIYIHKGKKVVVK